MSWKARVIDFVYFTVLVIALGMSGYIFEPSAVSFWVSTAMLVFYPDFTMWIKRRF